MAITLPLEQSPPLGQGKQGKFTEWPAVPLLEPPYWEYRPSPQREQANSSEDAMTREWMAELLQAVV